MLSRKTSTCSYLLLTTSNGCAIFGKLLMKTLNVITTADAAEMLGVTRQAVRKMVLDHKIQSTWFGRQWMFDRGDIERLKKIRTAKARARALARLAEVKAQMAELQAQVSGDGARG